MIDYKDKILTHIILERDFYKEATAEVRRRRDKMFKESFTNEWQEIADAYKSALFMLMFDLLIDKLSDVPVEDLYCELEEMKIDEIFEPRN